MRIAYLNTEYPALSHTFIEREVRALRETGIDVRTFSVRPAEGNGTLSSDHREAAATTRCLLDSPWKVAGHVLLALIISPLRSLRVFASGQRHSPPGLSFRLRHIGYAAQAIRLAREMDKGGIRHVHVHMANNGAMIALLATVFDRRLTYSLTIHGSAEFFDVHNVRLKLKAERAEFVRCISNFCRAQVMTWAAPETWERFHVVHCGVDTSHHRPAPPTNHARLRLLTVGRMVPIKGYPLLLKACRKLQDRGFDWQLTMIGDGPTRADLERLTDELGIADHVDFTGAVGQDEIGKYFDQANVMVVSSFMEGIPVVLMEAMARELAVIATHVGGIGELVESGQSGWLIEAGCVDALADALLEAAADPSRLSEMGEVGRRRVEEQFAAHHVGAAMRKLFARYAKPTALLADAPLPSEIEETRPSPADITA